jgi:hypothetical protein
MSLFSSLQTGFKNVGHYLATGAKYLAVGIKDVVLVANKSQAVQPELEFLIGALAGPQAAAATDLAFHAFGAVAAALAPVADDATALAQAQTTLSQAGIQLDLQTLRDIKAAASQIEQILKALGAKKPA